MRRGPKNPPPSRCSQLQLIVLLQLLSSSSDQLPFSFPPPQTACPPPSSDTFISSRTSSQPWRGLRSTCRPPAQQVCVCVCVCVLVLFPFPILFPFLFLFLFLIFLPFLLCRLCQHQEVFLPKLHPEAFLQAAGPKFVRQRGDDGASGVTLAQQDEPHTWTG